MKGLFNYSTVSGPHSYSTVLSLSGTALSWLRSCLPVWTCPSTVFLAIYTFTICSTFLVLSSTNTAVPMHTMPTTKLLLRSPLDESALSACVSDIATGMRERHLQLNLSKTAVLVFPAKPYLQHSVNISLCSLTVPTESARSEAHQW